MCLITGKTPVEEETLHKLTKVPGCCISNPCYQSKSEISGANRSKGNLHQSRMVNSEALQSPHLKGYKNHIGTCKSLTRRYATSCRQRCCTQSPSIPVHKVSQEPPLDQGSSRSTACVPAPKPGKLQTNCLWGMVPVSHWQEPDPCQSLCKCLNSTGDLIPLLKRCSHASLYVA